MGIDLVNDHVFVFYGYRFSERSLFVFYGYRFSDDPVFVFYGYRFSERSCICVLWV